jgi:hypothetical protein
MPIEFRCSGCGKLLRVPTEAAGKQARCPACGLVLPVPATSTDAAASPPPNSENPYRSPEYGGTGHMAMTPLSTVAVDAQELFGRTWAVFKNHWIECIVVWLIFHGILAVLGVVAFLLAVLSIAVLGTILALPVLFGVIPIVVVAGSAWIWAGMVQYFLRLARGQPAELSVIFEGGSHIAPMAIAWAAFIIFVTIGLSLLVVPGVIIALMFWPCSWIIVDRNAGVVESFESARQITAGNKWMLFLAFLGAGLVGGMLITMTGGLANLIVIPFMWVLSTVAYLSISGQWRAVAVDKGLD